MRQAMGIGEHMMGRAEEIPTRSRLPEHFGPMQTANEWDARSGCRGQRDLILIIGCWMDRQRGPARFYIIQLLPRLVWVTVTANVHSAL